MARYSATLRDNYNRPVDGALVYVTVASTGALAALTADDGSFLSNPFTSGPLGSVVFNANGDFYNLAYWVGGRELRTDNNINVGGASSLPPGSVINSLSPGSTSNAPSQAAVIAGIAAASAFTQNGAGAITSTVDAKLKQTLQTVRDRGADNTGTTDARPAFIACDALGAYTVPPGLYLINSSLTISNLVSFSAGARLVIPTGVTVTFNGGIQAGDYQIFNITGTGAVAGLLDVNALWFCGDAWNNPARVDGRALIQKALDACAQPVAGRANVRLPSGFMKHDGIAITVTKGQQIRGTGNGGTSFLWSTTLTAGFAISGASGALIEGIGCSFADFRILPTAGDFISLTGGFLCTIRDIFCGVAWNGITFSGGCASCTIDNVQIYECFNAGIYITDSGDIYTNHFLITTGFTYLTLTGITGTFQVGEAFVGGPSTAILAQVDGNIYRLNGSTLFTVGSTITGATSGATATISACQVPLQQGGIRLIDHCEAIIFSDGDVIGGQYPLVTFATTNSVGLRPAYNKFNSVYFDSSINGTNCVASEEFDFVSCWWAGPGVQSAQFASCDGFKFTGGGAINCGGNGHVIQATCTNFVYNGMSIRGNGRTAPNTFSGLLFKAGVGRFHVSNCIGDDDKLGFGTQRFAVQIEAGASDNYVVSNNRFTATQVSDGGTGGQKFIGQNF